MSGTSSVAYAMKRIGKRVVANDCLHFNYRTAQAFIENPSVHLSPDDTTWLLARHRTVEYTRFIQQTFAGMYFTAEENAWLDQTAANITALSVKANDPKIAESKTALAQHALVQACLAKRPFNLFHRKNLYLRQAVVPRRFGNKTTWETPFPQLFAKFIAEANTCVFDNGQDNVALNHDVVSLPTFPVDLVYLDPPYFGQGRERSRSNYRFLYHFVEGLVQYERWPYILNNDHPLAALKAAGHSTDMLYSCPLDKLEVTYLGWLTTIIQQWPNSRIAISYKHPGVPSIRSLRQLLVETGRNTEIYAVKYAYALSKKNGKPKENIEVLLIGS